MLKHDSHEFDEELMARGIPKVSRILQMVQVDKICIIVFLKII